MAEFRSVHQFLVYCCNTPVQYAVAEFLKDRNSYTGISHLYQAKRDYFLSLIRDSRFKFTSSSGTYFQLLDYSAITDEPDTDFAVRLTKEHKVAAIPVSVFYPDKVDSKVLRFCFAKKEKTLKKAAQILSNI
jgi:methionine aminotransferase